MDVTELDKKIEHLLKLRQEKEAIADTLSEKNKEIEAFSLELSNILKEMGRKNYHGTVGAVSVETRWSVNIPKSKEDLEAFFSHLQKEDKFYELATVNWQTLNSYFNEEYESAKQKGMGLEFSIPGIGAQKPYERLVFRKKGAKANE